jgi:hypothetical protein
MDPLAHAVQSVGLASCGRGGRNQVRSSRHCDGDGAGGSNPLSRSGGIFTGHTARAGRTLHVCVC